MPLENNFSEGCTLLPLTNCFPKKTPIGTKMWMNMLKSAQPPSATLPSYGNNRCTGLSCGRASTFYSPSIAGGGCVGPWVGRVGSGDLWEDTQTEPCQCHSRSHFTRKLMEGWYCATVCQMCAWLRVTVYLSTCIRMCVCVHACVCICVCIYNSGSDRPSDGPDQAAITFVWPSDMVSKKEKCGLLQQLYNFAWMWLCL